MPGSSSADPPPLPIGTVVSRAILADLDRMVRHEVGTRRGADIEELHQMRVATRRLRTTLRTYRSVLDDRWADDLRARLKALAGALGAVRDLDVLIERLDREGTGPPDGPLARGLPLIGEVLRQRREDARTRLTALLDDPSHTALLDELREAARAPRCLDPDAPAGPLLAPLVNAAWRRLRTARRTMGLHDVRIRVKRLRYAAEAAEPAFGKPARKLAEAAGEAQDVLGAFQDAHVAGEVYTRMVAEEELPPAATFALGVLVAREETRATTAAAAWPEAWARLKMPKRRRFLAG